MSMNVTHPCFASIQNQFLVSQCNVTFPLWNYQLIILSPSNVTGFLIKCFSYIHDFVQIFPQWPSIIKYAEYIYIYIMQNLWTIRSPLFFNHSFRNYTLNLRQRSHNHVSHSAHSELDSSKAVSTFFHEHEFVQHLISGAMMHMLCRRPRQSHADVTNCIIHVSFTPTSERGWREYVGEFHLKLMGSGKSRFAKNFVGIKTDLRLRNSQKYYSVS